MPIRSKNNDDQPDISNPSQAFIVIITCKFLGYTLANLETRLWALRFGVTLDVGSYTM